MAIIKPYHRISKGPREKIMGLILSIKMLAPSFNNSSLRLNVPHLTDLKWGFLAFETKQLLLSKFAINYNNISQYCLPLE